MFQLWKLVLLCGLLAGTSASLLDNIRKDVLRKLKSGLEEGLNNLDSTLETIFQQLKTDFTLPQESNTEEAQDNPEEAQDNPEEAQDNPEEAQDSTEETQDSTEETQDSTEETQDNTEETQDNTEETQDSTEETQDNTEETQDNPEETQDNTEETQDSTEETQDSTEETQDNTEETKNLLEQLISGIFQVVYRLTGVKISDLHILDLTLEATSDSSAEVKIPITAHVSVKLPVFGEVVDLGLNLVLQFSVSVETDEETGVSQVVVQECKNDQQSIELTVLGRRIGVLRQVVDFAVNLANEVLSLVTQSELCPEVSSLLESLDAEYVKNRIGELWEAQQEP